MLGHDTRDNIARAAGREWDNYRNGPIWIALAIGPERHLACNNPEAKRPFNLLMVCIPHQLLCCPHPLIYSGLGAEDKLRR